MNGKVVDGGDREEKVVMLLERPKGMPALPNLGGLKKNERSLFS